MFLSELSRLPSTALVGAREVLAPPLCWSCRKTARGGRPLCGRCRAELRFLGGVDPGGASDPGAASGPGARPGGSRGRPGPSVWAAVEYAGPARALVGALKFQGAAGLADSLAAMMVASAPAEHLRGELVPVPLHPARLRRRGFNQARLLADALSRRAGLAVVDCLTRGGSWLPQVGRDRAARLAGPAGTVSAAAGVPRCAVLVDDVMTTGATLAASTAALRAAGTEEVTALVFARTPGR